MSLLFEKWYIEYDRLTFSILNKASFEKYIFAEAKKFLEAASPLGSEETEMAQMAGWVVWVSQSVRDITQLLYNFFYVEEKLSSNERIKNTFLQIYTVLRVENLYTGFFFCCSEKFRVNRIMASCIRLNRFLEQIYLSIEAIKAYLDHTLIENLSQVYSYIEQKIKETLRRHCHDRDLNVVLLDMLSLLLRNSGDPTMKKVLDKTKQSKLLHLILQDNRVYLEFEDNKMKEKREYQKNVEGFGQFDVEEDPNRKKEAVVVEEQDD